MTLVPLLLMLCLPAFAANADPFAGVSESTAAAQRGQPPQTLFGENFGFRKELMSEFAAGARARASSRQSIGFETLKKFSSETATKAGVDFQGRLVRRDRFVPVQNDMEGVRRDGWWFEYHNAYLDLYNALDPFLSEDQQSRQVGRFNLRAGRFYVHFGLNLQTDTHGTILQLSNEQNFGFERDWYAGLWGSANEQQMQRVAVARALMIEPKVLVADEPTGNLDKKSGRSIFELFKKLATEKGLAIIITTHNTAFGYEADRVITLEDGKIVKVEKGGEVAA